MDSKQIFEVALAVINVLFLIIGFFATYMIRDLKQEATAGADAAKAASEDAKRASEALAAHQLYCARTYVTQEGLTTAIKNLEVTIGSLVQAVKDNMQETRQGFKDLYGKVDTKQDK